MAEIALPHWAADVIEQQKATDSDAAHLLSNALRRDASSDLLAAAKALVKEIEQRSSLQAYRRELEEIQRDLNTRVGKSAEAETQTELRSDVTFPWSLGDPPSREELLHAVVLLLVTQLDNLRATMELNSLRASVHYQNYELAYDNQVIEFHNAALRSRAEAAHKG